MGYPTKLLSAGETIQFEMRPHWRSLILPVIWLVLLVFFGVWIFVGLGSWSWSSGGLIETIGRWIIGILGVFVLIWGVIIPFLRWITTQYVFTDRRIITRAGVISKVGRDMPLSKVNNVTFEVGVLGRFLNYGNLAITSASDQDLVIKDVPNVEVIQRDVYRLHEEDDERRRTGGNLPPSDS